MINIPMNHGLQASYSRSLWDHLMHWDPVIRNAVHAVCVREFNKTFDEMLMKNPRWITLRTPQYVPPPSVIVPVIEHVFETFGHGLDAKTGEPLFNKKAWAKAKSILELAREGYLSDIKGVVLYEKVGIDSYGLQTYKCLRGTNKVEGGPHADIYKKFGALHGMSICSLHTFVYSHNLYSRALHHNPS